jgi:hypothetical protein
MAFVPKYNGNDNIKQNRYQPKSNNGDEMIFEAKKKVLGNIDTSNGLEKAAKLLKLLSTSTDTTVGMFMVGAIANVATAVINNSTEMLPYYARETVKSLGVEGTKVYTLRLNVGRKSTFSLLSAERQNGSAIVKLSDSIIGSVGTESRSYLSKKVGFNQKSFDFLSTNFYLTVNDYESLYNASSWKIPEHSVKVPYGLVMQEYNKLKIRNSNTYHPIEVKIHLIKILDDDLSMFELFRKVFNRDPKTQDSGTIPASYQISEPQPRAKNSFMYTTICYSSATLNLSSAFKTQAKVCKTFKKTLNPGDTYVFNLIHSCGSGVRIDVLNTYLNGSAKGDQPTGYGIIVEVIGTECEGIRITDKSVFLGTSPAYYNYEFSKAVKVVKNNAVTSTSMDLTDPELNGVKSTYAIRVFDRELLSGTPFNVSPDLIGYPGETGKTFSVVSTSDVTQVFSKNITDIQEDLRRNTNNFKEIENADEFEGDDD